MAVFIRAKRVSDPLDDRVKARIRGDDGPSSSGSDHAAATCLSGLVHAFLEIDGHDAPSDPIDCEDADSSADSEADAPAVADRVRELLNPLTKSDPFRARLHADVVSTAESLSELRPQSGSAYRRAVMARLREAGYNAGVCKSKWGSAGGLTAGSYEYIDVVGPGPSDRYIVDLGFAAEFEVARSTSEYGLVAAAIPGVAVAREGEVAEVVRIAAEAARGSLKRRGLHVPPWRKRRYMLAKWLGPYKRTVNALPAKAGGAAAAGGEVKCRAVGFPAAAGGSGLPLVGFNLRD